MVVNGLTQVEKLNKKLLKGHVFFCGNFTKHTGDNTTGGANVCMRALKDTPESLAEPWSVMRLGRPGTACVVRYQTACSTSVAWTLL